MVVCEYGLQMACKPDVGHANAVAILPPPAQGILSVRVLVHSSEPYPEIDTGASKRIVQRSNVRSVHIGCRRTCRGRGIGHRS